MRRRFRATVSATLALAGLTALAARGAGAQRGSPIVAVTLPQGGLTARRAPVTVQYGGDPGTYVAVLRIDTDGNMTVLVPAKPNERSKMTGPDESRTVQFAADGAIGVGTVVILGSRTPFDFHSFRDRSGRWVPMPAGRTATREDAIRQFADRTTRRGESPSMDYAEYSVQSNPIADDPPIQLLRDGRRRFDPCATGLYGSQSEQWRCADGRSRSGSRPSPRGRD